VFWRPVTVLTHWLDYQLWPTQTWIMHAHSLLWYGGLAFAVALLYRRTMGAAWIAGLAALLYAIDDAHGPPVGWIANRNTVIATFFGVCTLLAHDRWRRDKWGSGAVIGPLLLAVSLLSAEAGVATCAYLLAHVLFLDGGSWRRRCLVLLPYAVVVVACASAAFWVCGRVWRLHDRRWTVRFAAAAVQRVPILLLGQWALPPATSACCSTPPRSVTLRARHSWFSHHIADALVAPTMSPVLGARHDAVAAADQCDIPADRLLLFVGIGASGLLAQFLAQVFGRADVKNPPRSPLEKGGRKGSPLAGRARAVPALHSRPALTAAVAGLFVVLHLVAAPIALPIRAGFLGGLREVANMPPFEPPLTTRF
jgi:hypothetical protein